MTPTDRSLLEMLVVRGRVPLTTALDLATACDREGRPLREALLAAGLLREGEIDDLAARAGPAEQVPTLQGDQRAVQATPLPTVPPRIGRFEVLGPLGAGGMGVVYKARDPKLDRIVAIKVLHGFPGPEDPRAARFRREAQTAARLRHPRIVQVHEVGEEAGLAWIAMDFVEGTTLREVLDRGTTDRSALVTILRDVADGLAYAHAEGVVHRDVKPENILVGADQQAGFASGRAVLADFGLAKERFGSTRVTASGIVVGTPGYMAPEQATGSQGEVGPPGDVWSLGAVLYEALTRRPPFPGEGAIEVLFRIVSDEVEPPSRIDPSIPPDLEAICLKCLEKDPRRRYPDAGALLRDLDRHLAGEPVEAKRPSIFARIASRRRRRKSDAPSIALLLAILVVGSVFAWKAWTREDAPPGSSPRPGVVRVRGMQPGATVRFQRDGRAAVVADLARGYDELAPGHWTVRAEAPGCFPHEVEIDVASDRETDLGIVLDPMVVWDFKAGEAIFSTPQLADLDGDELPDVWFQSRDRKGRVLSGVDGSVLAEWPTPKRAESSIALADLDGAGLPEVVFGCDDGTICAWSVAKDMALWSFKAGGTILSSPLIVDVSGDGRPEVVMGSLGGQVYTLEGRTGLPLNEPVELGEIANTACAMPRVGPPRGFVIAAHGKGVFRVWVPQRRAGRPQIAWHHERVSTCYPSPAMFVWSGEWVVALDDEGTLTCLDAEWGREKWSTSVGGRCQPSPVVGDLECDGSQEVVVVRQDGTVVIVDADTGALERTWPGKGHVGGSPALADLDGDGSLDIVHGVGNCPTRSLVAYSGKDGRVLLDVAGLSDIHSSPVIGDVNGDGILEIVVGTYDARVVVLRARPPKAAWTHPIGGAMWEATADSRPGALLLVEGGRIRAVDADTGTVSWECARPPGRVAAIRVGEDNLLAFGGPSGLRRVRVNGGLATELGAEATGVVDVVAVSAGGRASFVVSTQEGLEKVDAVTGERAWRVSGAGRKDVPPRIWTACGDIDGDGGEDVLAEAEGRLIALSQRDGHQVWSAAFPGLSHGVAWLPGERPIALHASNEQALSAFAGRTGALLWRVDLPSRLLPGAALVADRDGDGCAEVVQATSGLGVLCLSSRDGREIWRSAPLPDLRVVGVVRTEPIGELVVATSPAEGLLLGLDPQTGRTLERVTIPPGCSVLGPTVAGSLILSHPAGRTWPFRFERHEAKLPWPRFRHDLENSGWAGR